MKVIEIARVAYEVNAAYCRSLDDESLVPWEEAESWQKSSVMNGIFFLMAHPDATPRSSHEHWLIEKEADGWSFGGVKDFKNKEHPGMLPFEDLSPAEQAKDYIFLQLVRSLRGKGGFRFAD